MLSAFQDILCLHVSLIADGVGIRSGSSDQEIQRLHPGIAGALGHNIKELSVRLGMQLVKDNAVDIEAVLTVASAEST